MSASHAWQAMRSNKPTPVWLKCTGVDDCAVFLFFFDRDSECTITGISSMFGVGGVSLHVPCLKPFGGAESVCDVLVYPGHLKVEQVEFGQTGLVLVVFTELKKPLG